MRQRKANLSYITPRLILGGVPHAKTLSPIRESSSSDGERKVVRWYISYVGSGAFLRVCT